MAQPKALLDTDTLSAVMKGNPLALARARDYLAEHGAFTLSIITRYEILRGLKAKNATTPSCANTRPTRPPAWLLASRGLPVVEVEHGASSREWRQP